MFLSVRDVLLASLPHIPKYKSYFVGMYTQKPTNYIIKFNPAVNDFVRVFAKKEPEYFEVLDDFINKYLATYFNKKAIRPDLFLRIECLAVVMPNMVEWMQNNPSELSIFRTCQYFLANAAKKQVPLDYYPHLAFMLITDEINYNLNKIHDPERRAKAEENLNAIRTMTVRSFMFLDKYSKMSKEKITVDGIPIKPTDVFVYNGKAYGLKLWEGNNAQVINILADRGAGKTVALMRCIYSCLNQGYTVIVIGNDTRNEFRFASFPLTFESNQSMYSFIKRQNEKVRGLPITIYCDEPKYPNEKSIDDFNGTPKEWQSLNGVILFESEKIDESEMIKSIIIDEKTGRDKKSKEIIRTHRLIKIMKSFIKWRAENRTKKIVMCINEAQRLFGSMVTRRTAKLFFQSDELLENIRGMSVPLILNTQYLSKLRKAGRQANIGFFGYVTNPKERRLISETYGIKTLKSLLLIPELMKKKLFFKTSGQKVHKIRFLVPPFMPENNAHSLKYYYKRYKKKIKR
jgi:Ni2+-binding GTPase involved in maturation of urease and hydrogenase